MRCIRYFHSADRIDETYLQESTAVVCDVLRASSTIVTALYNGCREIIPVIKVNHAIEKAKTFGRFNIVIGGERKGKPLDYFDCGNSPLQYSRETVHDKIVVLTTTNGTKALVRSANAKEVVVLSFLNLSAISQYILRKSVDVCAIAAGANGRYSLEDAVCCGLLIDQLLTKSPEEFMLNKEARKIYNSSLKYKNKIELLFLKSQHGRYLEKIGYGEDLVFCSKIDVFNIVPYYENGSIRLL